MLVPVGANRDAAVPEPRRRRLERDTRPQQERRVRMPKVLEPHRLTPLRQARAQAMARHTRRTGLPRLRSKVPASISNRSSGSICPTRDFQFPPHRTWLFDWHCLAPLSSTRVRSDSPPWQVVMVRLWAGVIGRRRSIPPFHQHKRSASPPGGEIPFGRWWSNDWPRSSFAARLFSSVRGSGA